MERVLISVVIPVHNCARYLGEAIESVLTQGGPADVEVIVVDDGSTDDSAAVARSYGPRVTCHSEPESRGPGAARNRGVAMARGEFVAFLDADDVWSASKLTRQLAVMRAKPRADLSFGAVRHFISPELDPETAARFHCPDELQRGYVASAMLARRDAFDRVGPIREDLRVGELIDWMARARDCGLREVLLPEEVVRRRIHGANLSLRQLADRADFARIIKASLDRRRAAAAAEAT
jgi:glycosyltransferase involved in cell wall biosynthesis